VWCPLAGTPLPDACHRIRRECLIAADDRNPLDHRLGDDEPVERITVMERQARQGSRMLWFNGQNDEPVIRNPLLHECLVELRQRILIQTDLDGDFPIAGRTDQLLVAEVFDMISGMAAQLRSAEHEPQEGVRVEQNPHGIYSLKSSRCASSSATMVSMPL